MQRQKQQHPEQLSGRNRDPRDPPTPRRESYLKKCLQSSHAVRPSIRHVVGTTYPKPDVPCARRLIFPKAETVSDDDENEGASDPAPGPSKTAKTACDKCSLILHTNEKHVCEKDETPKFKKNSIVCVHCQKRFKTFWGFTQHIMAYHGPPAKCSTCGEKFKNKHLLREHVGTAHPAPPPPPTPLIPPPPQEYKTRSGRVSKKRFDIGSS